MKLKVVDLQREVKEAMGRVETIEGEKEEQRKVAN